MHFNYLFVPTFIGAILFFILGLKAFRVIRSASHIVVWSIAAAILAVILALPALLFVAYYGHILDAAIWFYAFRAAPYTELSAAGLGSGAGLMMGFLQRTAPTRHPALRKLLAPALILFCSGLLFIPYAKPLIAPIRTPQHDRWSQGVCLQSTPSTCGPCSAATLLRQFNIPASERDLSGECFSYRGGTENWYVARALRHRGMETQYLITLPQPTILPFPAMAGVRLGGPRGGGHFITILGRDGDRYIIGDPLIGKLVLTPKQLHFLYYFTGFFLRAKGSSRGELLN